jgi:hypothetical protein
MRKHCLVLAGAILLCAFGPPPPYDASALPAAAAAREHLLNTCQARAATFTTDRARVACGLAAYRAYAVTERLRDMSLFQAYATAMQRISAGVDAGKLSASVAYSQSAAARAQYLSAVDKQYADWNAGQPHTGPLFDRAALPAADAALTKAVQACHPWTDAKSIEPRTLCILAAEKTFATAIRLQDMDLFYGYASVLHVDAVDAEDGKRPLASLDGAHRAAWADFRKMLEQRENGWWKKR